jgi:hypothetical protein
VNPAVNAFGEMLTVRTRRERPNFSLNHVKIETNLDALALKLDVDDIWKLRLLIC